VNQVYLTASFKQRMIKHSQLVCWLLETVFMSQHKGLNSVHRCVTG